MKKPKRTAATTVVAAAVKPSSRQELQQIRMHCLSEAIRANDPDRTLLLAKQFESFITTGK